MRLARLSLDGREVAAIEHQGVLFRVDLLDRALGSPLPDSLRRQGERFQRRVFSMAAAGLDDHLAEIVDGTRLDDCLAPSPPAILLPPCGEAPALFELRPGASLPLRLEGRSLRGHEDALAMPHGESVLWVRAGLAIVLTENLHLPSEGDVRAAMGGLAAALSWEAPGLWALAEQQGLGPGPGRVAGTHLGPFLELAPRGEPLRVPGSLVLSADHGAQIEAALPLDAVERAAQALLWIGRHADLEAGDVLLVLAEGAVAVAPGGWACVEGPGGTLRGGVG